MGLSTTTLTLIAFAVLFTVIQSKENIRNKRRMYAMCPPKFQRIGSECYAISDQQANWLEAHFQCKDKNSKLAEPNSKSDKKLRAFFQKMDHDTDEIWIGATYDWNINIWQWSISGKNLTYDAFSRLDPESRQSLEYNCAVLNPSLKYRWSARPCVDKHRYICQHKMPKVSEKNRFKVYSRWNQTYPNQLANEVEMVVVDTESRDGKRITRRLKPLDSSENYPMPPRRSPESSKPRRRPHVPPKETNNDINVQFIPNYLTNEINEGVSYRPPTPATMFPLTMDFIPADMSLDNSNHQAAQPYMDTTTTSRPRHPTNAPSKENETTVTQTRPRTRPTGKRVRTKFDDIIEEKRKIERSQKRAEHRRRKQERMRRKQEEERKRQEQERKKQEDERKREEEERKSQEEERKKQKQLEITNLKLKQAEEEKEREAALFERQKLEDKLRISKEEQERQEREEAILKEQREEEEERIRKQRLHEQTRLQLEYEERLKKQQTERERILEEEKQKEEENRRRIEQEQAARQAELKRLQEEDEKRLELQRMEIERKRHEKELARLEEENQKRIAAQKAREEEIRRREEALAAELAEEKRLQEELRKQEEHDRLMHEQELQNEIEEKKRKEEAERLEAERKEEIRKKKYQERLAKEAKKLEEQKKLEEAAKLEEEKRRENKEKIRKYAERISRLSPEMQALFLKARKERKRNKLNSNNEASIPERK